MIDCLIDPLQEMYNLSPNLFWGYIKTATEITAPVALLFSANYKRDMNIFKGLEKSLKNSMEGKTGKPLTPR